MKLSRKAVSPIAFTLATRVSRLVWLTVLLCGGVACGPKKTTAVPPSETPGMPMPASPDQPTPTDVPVPAPVLEVAVSPSVISPGESAILSWQATNASGVTVEPAIGPVDGRGQIRVFPAESTTYQFVARGPGGSARMNATIRVVEETTTAEDVPAPPRNLNEEFKEFVKPVFFEYEQAALDAESRLTLDGNVLWLSRDENLGIRFVVRGHCDVRGTDEYSLALGDRRAQLVRAYLSEKGIEASRIDTLSLGEESLTDERDTDAAQAPNRRAEFHLLKTEDR